MRSTQSNKEELKVLLSDFNLARVCLQETRIKPNTNIQFKDFSAYHCPGNVTDGIVYGGVGILVNNSFAHKSITLNTHLQAVAVHVSCHKTITVCSLYLPPSLRWTKKILKNCYLNYLRLLFYWKILTPTVLAGAVLIMIARVRSSRISNSNTTYLLRITLP